MQRAKAARVLFVVTTAGTADEAERIATAPVTERLAAETDPGPKRPGKENPRT